MKFTQWILFSSGVTSALLVSVMYQTSVAPQTAQAQSALLAQTTTDQLPRLPQQDLTNRISTPPAPIDVPAQADAPVQTSVLIGKVPTMMMSVPEGSVSVQLKNMTAESLTYQALGDTEPRTLDAEGEVTLSNLRVPTTVTFSYENTVRNRLTNSGLTTAKVRSAEDGVLELVVEPTTDLDTEASNLTVESGGGVFVF